MNRTHAADHGPANPGEGLPIPYFMKVLRTTLAGCALLAILPGPAYAWSLFASDQEKAEVARQERFNLDTHVATVSRVRNVMFRLGAAGAPLCQDDVKSLYGFEAATYRDFPKALRDAAEAAGYDSAPTILYVAERSPAEAAGLRVGDRIKSVSNQQVSQADSGKAVIEALAEAGNNATAAVPLQVMRDGDLLDMTIIAIRGCDYELEVVANHVPDAATDGRKFLVTTGLLDIVQGDEDLAFVLGHEMGHAGFGHNGKKLVGRILGAAVDAGVRIALGGVGAQVVSLVKPGERIGAGLNSKDFEREADYLGAYLMARAGYDIDQTRDLWRRLAAEAPAIIQKSFWSSHPNSPERMLLIGQTVAEIKSKQRDGKDLMPDMKDDNSGRKT